ncbi:23S rRNA pseudouridine2605 synthase [Sphingomonas sp. BE123]|uniref:pseudouridine synthase n=1 Tax=Sphingomonas sp. BE123 TaxID=2817842 RepID=UPI00286702DF|nr:pseudouridine synthase [Sphingomonas sp. BE123]MDR6850967.1 23S rRNA pseudouridine2605 synthase [Sphingomonas sp. BE123]
MSPAPTPESSRPGDRIAKLLARAGIASRREVERMIAEGRVALDGQVLTTPATVLTSLHGVTVDGNPVAAPAPARLFRFHKPAGLLTTERDPAGRPTIYDTLPKGLPRLMPVGRLDLSTEGLLLMTTDGELKRQLELPATGVERSYRARAYGQVSQEQLEELMLGVEIEGVRYGSINANLERRTGANVWIELTLTEGKNREVRRVLEHLGLKVSRLIRTRYGPFELADMPVGAVDEIRQHDLIVFRKALTGPGGGKAASNLHLSGKSKAIDAPPEAAPADPAATPPANRAERRKAGAQISEPEAYKPARPQRPEAEKKGPEKFGVGQRRRHQAKTQRQANPAPFGEGQAEGQRRPRPATAEGPVRPGRNPRPDAPGRSAPASGKPFAKPSTPRHAQHDDDGSPLLDRPKRARPTDRRPTAAPGKRPPTGKGGPTRPPRGTPAPGKRGPRS